MPRKPKSKDPAAIAALEVAPLESKPKRRRSAVKQIVESREPQTLAAVLENSPVAAIIADHQAEAAFQRQRDREQSVPDPEQRVPSSFAAAVKASRAAFAPIPEGFVNVDSYPVAGLKFNRSRDNKVAAIQFAEDRPLSRAAEYDKMREIQDAGFVYKTARRQWERYDGENPGANLMDAKRVADNLAKEREGQSR